MDYLFSFFGFKFMFINVNYNQQEIFPFLVYKMEFCNLPHKYIEANYDANLPFVSPIETAVPFVSTALTFLVFDLFTGNRKSKKTLKKFKPLPKLVPLSN